MGAALMPERPAADLLDPRFLKKLDYLNVVAKKLFSGAFRGERESRKRGAGTLFADYRRYAMGDDLRYVDWNVYGRLDALHVKLFEAEESLELVLLLDLSRSMDFGAHHKGTVAKRVAAALGYIGLSNLDAVRVWVLRGGAAENEFWAKGKPATTDLLRFLAPLPCEGTTDLYRATVPAVARVHKRGVAIVVSDFLDAAYAKALKFLLYQKFQVYAIHVVDRLEWRPEVEGTLRLVDLESGEHRDVEATPSLLHRYRQAFERRARELERFCLASEIGYSRVPTDVAFDVAVLRLLRKGGVLR
ncbi:MAG: DUF58 domain-containing protein [Planctomycetes bacterium]|nr:DUF58 domain-containing protein [Planctomycetota bacterium]MBI3847537.1 DUF58 domain-containing protein [Planctomycetota bacterium]